MEIWFQYFLEIMDKVEERLEGGSDLIDDELKIIAIVIIAAMMGVAVYPIITAHRIVEPFSELGVLGPNGKLGDYPRNVTIGQTFTLFLYVGDHEGRAEYYQVQVKVGNRSSNVSDTVPLSAPVIARYDFVLMDGENRTTPVTLSMPQQDTNQRMVFELYIYDPSSAQFVYDQRWTQIWLNVTSPR